MVIGCSLPSGLLQYFLFSRIIGLVTPKINYFYYLKKYFLDQSIQKIFYSILKKEALVSSLHPEVLLKQMRQWLPVCITRKDSDQQQASRSAG